ncbi:MAG: hypothetical protein V1901_03155 [Patescibacteria group bacterium]
MIKKIALYSLFIAFSLTLFSFSVLAEENDDISSDVLSEELNIEDPGILSWFQNAFDTIQLWVTRDLVKKSELELKKASRQIIKVRELVQNNADDKNLQNKFNKIDEKYQGLIDGINNRIEEFNEENLNSEKFKNFLDKYTDHQFKHLQILEKLENQVPETVMEKIQEKRQEHLEKFNGVMNKIQEKKENKEQETNKNNNNNGEDDNNEEEDDNDNGNNQNNSGNGQQNQKGKN